MNHQYCKVGAISPMDQSSESLRNLESRYRDFKRKAEKAIEGQNPLHEFFEHKARQMERLLNEFA